MTRETFGWGDGAGLAFRNHTHLPKVHGETPAERRAKRRHKPLRVEKRVWERDGFTCRKCGYRCPLIPSAIGYFGELTVDHVIPASCGGSDESHNLTTLCRACNTRRGAYYPAPAVLL